MDRSSNDVREQGRTVRETLGDSTAAAAHVIAAGYFRSYSVVGLLALVGVLFVAVAFGAGYAILL